MQKKSPTWGPPATTGGRWLVLGKRKSCRFPGRRRRRRRRARPDGSIWPLESWPPGRHQTPILTWFVQFPCPAPRPPANERRLKSLKLRCIYQGSRRVGTLPFPLMPRAYHVDGFDRHIRRAFLPCLVWGIEVSILEPGICAFRRIRATAEKQGA